MKENLELAEAKIRSAQDKQNHALMDDRKELWLMQAQQELCLALAAIHEAIESMEERDGEQNDEN